MQFSLHIIFIPICIISCIYISMNKCIWMDGDCCLFAWYTWQCTRCNDRESASCYWTRFNVNAVIFAVLRHSSYSSVWYKSFSQICNGCILLQRAEYWFVFIGFDWIVCINKNNKYVFMYSLLFKFVRICGSKRVRISISMKSDFRKYWKLKISSMKLSNI